MKRRQGKWDEALQLQAEAEPLDPRNTNLLSEQAATLRAVRRFADAHRILERALEITPKDPLLLAQEAEVYEAEGNLEGAGKLLALTPLEAREPYSFGRQVVHLGLVGKLEEAIQALENALRTPEALSDVRAATSQGWIGALYTIMGNKPAATEDLLAARTSFEAIRIRGASGALVDAYVVQIDELLGDRSGVEAGAARLQDAINDDANFGPAYLTEIASARSWLGQTDNALGTITHLLKTPGYNCLTPALLRLDPIWKPLRDDPQFQQLAEAKP